MRQLRDVMLKQERQKLLRLLSRFLDRDPEKLVDIMQQVMVETAAGPLRVHFDVADFGCICCRFDEPDLAKWCLHGNETIRPGGPQRLNPCSGKWNFHFGRVTAAEAMRCFEVEFAKVAPTTPKARSA